MRLPDNELLFRFIGWDDYLIEENGTARVRTSLYRLSFPVSFNRESIWPLQKNVAVAPPGFGICSMTCGEVAGVKSDGGDDLYVQADPIKLPDLDPLLGIENPAHASASRKLTGNEAKRAARISSQQILQSPMPQSSKS